ncbi:hypothetical protein V8G54_032904 [Vigna mungo]|uniref:Uncharacterized protein n=1 Tax=Vigna mungo TaxID=3915 RepID=A0AAQ3MMV6_VIGMU
MSGDASSGNLPSLQGGDDIYMPIRKRGRSGTWLRELTVTRNADHRLPIRFDMKTCKPLGENSTKFISYVALLGRSKASILCDDWDHVPENVKNQIWQSIFNFKTMLTSRYIYGSKVDKNPYEKYQFLDEETWQAFKKKRLDPVFQAKRKAAQEIAKKNLYPHRLSREGYEKLEQKMMKEASASNPSGASDTSTIIRPPRYDTWKRARQRPSGEYTSKEVASIASRIDELVEQSTQGTFIPEGREDILAVAIGRPEHSGRVFEVLVLKGIREEIRQEMREEMREEISEMKKEYSDMRAQLKKIEMRAELASPLGQPRNPPQPTPLCISIKESCDVSPQHTSPTVNADYELFSDDAL